MHRGVDFEEPADAGDGEVTVQRARETEREVAVGAATRGASSADAGYDEGARTPDAVEAAQHHESGTETPGLVESVTGGDAETADSLLGPLFTFLDRGGWRRLVVVVGIPLALVLTVESTTANLSWLVVTASLLFGVHLLRRVSTRETVAAGALGAGVIVLGVIGFDTTRVTLADGLASGFETLAAAWPALPVAVASLVAGWVLRE